MGGSVRSPQLLEKDIVQLSDPSVPKSRQPFHAAEGLPQAKEKKAVVRIA
jgi:hypothetical protein